MCDFRYLQAFRATAHQLNFGRAAKELGISISALSRQVALLEASAGQQLFIRSTRKVVLTSEGQLLFKLVEDFEQKLTQVRKKDIPLRIACLQTVFEDFFIDFILSDEVVFRGPVNITIGTPEGLQKRAQKRAFDLILNNILPAPSSGLSAFKLYRESLAWTEPLRKKTSKQRSIVFSAFEHLYTKEELESDNRIWINSYNAALEMTRKGIGTAILPMRLRTGVVQEVPSDLMKAKNLTQ